MMEVYNNPEQEMGGMPYGMHQDYEDELPDPRLGASRSINQDQMFMRWLFSFRKEVVEPLSYVWRGYEFDHNKSEWVFNPKCKPIMNEVGINWCISLIDSYINPVFVVSNYDEQFMNYNMLQVTKVIWNSLCKRWKEFGITDKTDIPRIANEIESKILSIMLGARGDGFRKFFAQQYRISEIQNNSYGQMQDKQNLMGKMMTMFTPKQENKY